MKKLLVALSLAAALTGSAVFAHDFFLLPDQFQTNPAGSVKIKATVGSSFPSPGVVVATDRVEHLTVTGAGKPKIRIVGSSTSALDLEVTGAKPGLLVAAVTSKSRDVDYTEERIPLILEEYRFLPDAAGAVDQLTRPRTWRVSSRRFAKTFVCIQRCNNRSVGKRASGANLEFVSQGSSTDGFQLLRNGSALANYPVDLVGPDGTRQHLFTDERGEIRLPAGSRGAMMLFAAFLVPPNGGERFTLDLSSLTFAAP